MSSERTDGVYLVYFIQFANYLIIRAKAIVGMF
jgi:hypothetical protein